MTTTEQTWEKLVWAEKPCEPAGTGFVLLLADLSEDCPCVGESGTRGDLCGNCYGDTDKTDNHGRCTQCRTGRVPKPIDGFRLLKAMRKAGFIYTASTYQGWEFFERDDLSLKPMRSENLFFLDDLVECILAAWKAVLARHPQEEKA